MTRSRSTLALAVTLAGVVVLAGAGVAAAQRRPAPDRYLQAAADIFDRAAAADAAGRRDEARDLYVAALELAPHPNPAFNLAHLVREEYLAHGSDWGAVEDAFRLYLMLAPDGPDRRQVQADLTAWKRQPVTLTLLASNPAVDLAQATVLVDGVIVLRPGPVSEHQGKAARVLTLPPGPHEIDVLTPLVVAEADVTLAPLRPATREVAGRVDRSPANVIFSGSNNLYLRGPAIHGSTPRRVQLPPGRHAFHTFYVDVECAPFEVDAPRTGYVLVFLGPACPKVVRITPVGSGG